MRKFSIILFGFIIAGFAACGTGGGSEEGATATADSTQVETTPTNETANEAVAKYVGDVLEEKGGIKLRSLKNSPQFVSAALDVNQPKNGAKLPVGKLGFGYNVSDFELGAKTLEDIPLANSGQGQHVHLILNNNPYHAHYHSAIEMDMEAGHYVALSFLSRSYHESVKTKQAYVITQFNVGDGKGKDIDVTKPLMFYSRPKGEYKGADTKYVLLDFYLVNVALSEYGYTVRATVNGNEFMLNTWEPYLLEGLPMGDNTIKLELLDKNGELVDAPYNPVKRTVKLSEADPA